jgi:tetratricopeptide (TPR) repeat protein
MPPDPFQAHLNRATALFEAGDAVQAGQIWQAILKREPGHQAAREGLYRVKQFLVDQLVREGLQLYDLGMPEEAAGKWRRALELQPGHKDALEYLEMARRDEAQAAARPRPPAPDPAAGQRETRIAHALQLLRDRRLEEASQAFQDLLEQGCQEDRVLQGYHQARAFLAARDEEPREAPRALESAPARPAAPLPVGPPRALTVRAKQRDGFRLPGAMGRLRLPRRLLTTRNLILAIGLAVLAILGLALYGVRLREAALKQAVATAKRNALKPVSRMVEIPSLAEPLEAVRAQAEQALAEDPLLAYFRAQEWQRRDPDNPAATVLVQRSKDKLTFMAPTATVADFDKALQSGDLEGAYRCILSLLRHNPDDLDLRGRARKVLLALAPLYAGNDRMGKARECLLLGRAMYPQDTTWPARLKLLEAIQDLAKPDRAPWIQLLG